MWKFVWPTNNINHKQMKSQFIQNIETGAHMTKCQYNENI